MPKSEKNVRKAYIYSSTAPSAGQEKRFNRFLTEKYGEGIALKWIEEPSLDKGFRLEVGSQIYDWSVEGRFEQLRSELSKLGGSGDSVVPQGNGSLKP